MTQVTRDKGVIGAVPVPASAKSRDKPSRNRAATWALWSMQATELAPDPDRAAPSRKPRER
jgi:hypothetical protein